MLRTSWKQCKIQEGPLIDFAVAQGINLVVEEKGVELYCLCRHNGVKRKGIRSLFEYKDFFNAPRKQSGRLMEEKKRKKRVVGLPFGHNSIVDNECGQRLKKIYHSANGLNFGRSPPTVRPVCLKGNWAFGPQPR